MPTYDVQQIKAACAGQWPGVIAAVAGIDRRILDGRHRPCPKRCGGDGGTDRFRMLDTKAGAVICNQCFNTGNGDGIAAIMWLCNCDFQEACRRLGEYLGIKPSAGRSRQPANPESHLEFTDWNEQLVSLWCLKKKPIKSSTLRMVGARLAHYRKRYKVIAIPVISLGKTVGWCLYNITGGMLPKWMPGNQQPELVKVKLTAGSRAGIIGHWPEGFTRAIKTEGPSDLLALLSLDDRPSDVAAFCNANGAKERTDKFEKDLARLKGKAVDVIHDADNPGQEGATWILKQDGTRRPGWCPWLATFAGPVRNVELPYGVQRDHGKDLRDWIADGNGFADLEVLADRFSPFEAVEVKLDVEESPDDPHRLARINLNKYQAEHRGRLVFWKDEWWKYKSGVYRRLGKAELKAKITSSIRHEFERLWHEADASDRERTIQKVTQQLVSNVYGATQSLVTISSNIPQPCWLPDRSRRQYISMANCLLDLEAFFEDRDENEVLLPHSDNWFSPTRLEYEFNAECKASQFIESIHRTCDGDMEKVRLIQEWFGYTLTPESEEQSFLVFEGEGGTGKSTIFAAMEAMLGSQNVSHLSLENMDEDFALSSTLGKSANIAGDVGKIKGNEEAILKRYTGGETIRMRRMYIPPIDARPTAKLMMAWNERPKFRDKSEGLWRRMILIPLNRKIKKSEMVKGMTNPSYWRNEAPGIFNWALAGLARLRQQGGFSPCRARDEAIKDFKHDASPSREFFEMFLELDRDSAISCSRLQKIYRHWAQTENLNPLGPREFGKELKRVHDEANRDQRRDGSTRYYVYQGIKFSVAEVAGMKVDDGSLFDA